MPQAAARVSEFTFASVPALWPIAMAAAATESGASLYARNLRFIDEEIKIHEALRPALATANTVRLDLWTMKLRDYGVGSRTPTLIVAPYAGHTAVIADYCRGQSLVETLLAHDVARIALTDWKSASSI